MKYYSKIMAEIGDGTVEEIKMKQFADKLSQIIDYDDDENDEPVENPLVNLLQVALVGEYQQWDMYTSYSSRLKGLSRSPIADEFKAHAGEELAHIDLLQRYLVSMGENPTLQRKSIPELESTSLSDIINLQLKFEKDAVELYQKLLALLPENESLKIDIENVLIKEQEHVHDLELLLNDHDSIIANTIFVPMEAGEETKPQAGYSLNNKLSKSDIDWCTKALKELTPDIYAKIYQGKLLTLGDKALVVKAISLKWGIKDTRTINRFLDSYVS